MFAIAVVPVLCAPCARACALAETRAPKQDAQASAASASLMCASEARRNAAVATVAPFANIVRPCVAAQAVVLVTAPVVIVAPLKSTSAPRAASDAVVPSRKPSRRAFINCAAVVTRGPSASTAVLCVAAKTVVAVAATAAPSRGTAELRAASVADAALVVPRS